jgi:hypothetical protein
MACLGFEPEYSAVMFRAWERREMRKRFCLASLKGKDRLESLGVDEG